jgi:hypothetical protein
MRNSMSCSVGSKLWQPACIFDIADILIKEREREMERERVREREREREAGGARAGCAWLRLRRWWRLCRCGVDNCRCSFRVLATSY